MMLSGYNNGPPATRNAICRYHFERLKLLELHMGSLIQAA